MIHLPRVKFTVQHTCMHTKLGDFLAYGFPCCFRQWGRAFMVNNHLNQPHTVLCIFYLLIKVSPRGEVSVGTCRSFIRGLQQVHVILVHCSCTQITQSQTRFVTLHSKIPPPPHCVPSDTVSHSFTVSICPLCCTWFVY